MAMRSVAMAAAAAVLMSAGAAEAAKEFKAAIGAGPKSAGTWGGYEPFIKSVEQASKGEMKIRLFVGGVLLGFKPTLEGLKNGVADLGWVVNNYYPAEMPNAQLVNDLAFLCKDAVTMAAATSEFNLLHCTDCVAEYRSQGIVDTGTASTPPYMIISKVPIRTVEDLKGKKLRVGAGVWNRWSQHFGAIPVSMASDDTYQGLTSGVIDATVHAGANLKSYNYWDTAKHVTKLPMGSVHSMSLVAWSQRTWSELKPDERRLILDRVAIAHVGTSLGYEKQEAEAFAEGPKHGLNVYDPDPALQKASDAWVAEDLKGIAAAREAAGVRNAAQKIAKFRELYTKWEKLREGLGDDEAKLVALFNREIYSKLDSRNYGM